MTVTGPAEAEAGGILTIDLGALVANWRALGKSAAPAECAGVIKADGYGCGIEPVAAALSPAGCRTFFVANIAEARRARVMASDATIYVLNGLLPGTASAYADAKLSPVIGSRAELDEWNAFRSSSGWQGGAALHVDTGMSRLGFALDEIGTVANLGTGHGIALLMSHFACSEEDHPLNAIQMERFRAVRALYPGIPGSLSNSSGIFLGPDAHHDLVRPGVALYGANPLPGRPNPMRSVVSLQGRIIQTRTVAKGDTVGYSATWTAKRASRLALVSIGYADGFIRAASASDARLGGAEAIVAGQRCRLAGRISMDLIAIDVTELAEGAVNRGDLVGLLGPEIGVDDLAARAGTIGYEVLTSLGRRYRRVYVD